MDPCFVVGEEPGVDVIGAEVFDTVEATREAFNVFLLVGESGTFNEEDGWPVVDGT